jgi:hypothetical protein
VENAKELVLLSVLTLLVAAAASASELFIYPEKGKGAAIGAAGGGLVGGMRRNDQRRREEQAQKDWEQDQVAQYTRARNDYNRAYAACLEGRNYTVK